jgi:hypothetical protein
MLPLYLATVKNHVPKICDRCTMRQLARLQVGFSLHRAFVGLRSAEQARWLSFASHWSSNPSCCSAWCAGVDGGTESIRAGVFDLDGRPLSFASAPYPTTFPAPGWAEQEPADWWAGLGCAVREAVASAGIQPTQVAALCVDTTCCTVVALDAAGDALRPALLCESMRVQPSQPGLEWARCRCRGCWLGLGAGWLVQPRRCMQRMQGWTCAAQRRRRALRPPATRRWP